MRAVVEFAAPVCLVHFYVCFAQMRVIGYARAVCGWRVGYVRVQFCKITTSCVAAFSFSLYASLSRVLCAIQAGAVNADHCLHLVTG